MENDLIAEIAKASPGELIEMLYARTIRDLRDAVELIDLQGDPRSSADAILKIVHAQQIISELNKSVNVESKDLDTQALSANLKLLYEYMQYRLVEAVATMDKNIINEITGLLVELHDMWSKMLEQAKRKGD